MSKNICGAECVDGSPCQHPADSCPVPSHADPSADNPQGRDFAIDEDDHEDILQAAREGFSKAGCARAAGVDEKSLQRYLEAGENANFRRAFMRARHKGERELLRAPLRDNPQDPVDVDGQHARFLLSTSFEYVKTEKRELEHSGEGDDGEILIDLDHADT
jgi:hypothetical protein